MTVIISGLEIPGPPYPSWRYHKERQEFPDLVIRSEDDDARAIRAGYVKNKTMLHQPLQMIDILDEFGMMTNKQLKVFAHTELKLILDVDMDKTDMICRIQDGLAQISERGRLLAEEIPGDYKQWQADISDAIATEKENRGMRAEI